MTWLTASWFTGFVLPWLIGFATQLWSQYQEKQSDVNSGAVSQQKADEAEKQKASADAQRISHEVDNQSSSSVDSDLSKWLSK